MKRRGPTFHDLWTIAVVTAAAMAVLLLCVGAPDVDFASGWRMSAAACDGAPECVRQAGP